MVQYHDNNSFPCPYDYNLNHSFITPIIKFNNVL